MDLSQWHLMVLLIECSLVIFLNIILIVFILLKRQLRCQICSLFLVNLFFAHTLEGLVGVARSSFLYSPKKKDAEKVNLSVNLFTTAVIFSYLTYIPVTLDRFIAIKYPFRYQAINFKKVAIINLTIWCVTICFGAVALTTGLSSRIGDAITVCFTVFMYLLTITTNVKIYGEVKRHTENLKRNCIEDGVGSKDNKGLNIPHGELTLESTSGNKTISPKRKFIHDPKSTVDQLLSVSNTANDTAQSSQNTFSKLALESPNELTVPVLATITPICEYSDNKITKKQNENCNSKLKPSDVSTEPSEKLIIQALTTKTSNSATKHQDNALELRNQQLFTTRPNELIIQKAHSSSVCEARPQNISSRPVLSKKKTRQYLDARCIRSAKMCSVIVITFACCWTPHALHDLLKITNAAPSIVYSDSILARTTLVVAFLNGIIDPILYVTMNKSLKKQIGKFKRRILNTVSPSYN